MKLFSTDDRSDPLLAAFPNFQQPVLFISEINVGWCQTRNAVETKLCVGKQNFSYFLSFDTVTRFDVEQSLKASLVSCANYKNARVFNNGEEIKASSTEQALMAAINSFFNADWKKLALSQMETVGRA